MNSFFGIVRSCANGQDANAPTATSFRRIRRMLPMYVQIQNALRVHGNIETSSQLLHRGIVKANFGIQDNHKLTSGLFERMKWMDLALQQKILNNEPEPDESATSSKTLPITEADAIDAAMS
ncbi:hypothetical protein GHT06_018550 [Daphnia sinensis]|uniref:Uncharacterized protein n=1 Tax=Daphnia sinensis TaxID=1820382 RepID=A0AAD5PQY1_9CRUS|nr:hypothetical protein GHT06_018550 [Daphnia sinensis]